LLMLYTLLVVVVVPCKKQKSKTTIFLTALKQPVLNEEI